MSACKNQTNKETTDKPKQTKERRQQRSNKRTKLTNKQTNEEYFQLTYPQPKL